MAQVTGLDPSVLVSPDYQVQMQRAQRQAALAQALRSQSLQDTPGNGGSVSWTQGVARLADALAANISNKRSEKTQMGANRAYAQGMARMFGLNTPPSQQPNPAAPMSASPQMPQGAPASGPPMPQAAPQVPQQAPAGSPADNLAPLPDAPPQAAPPPPAAAPMPPQGGAPSMGPMNLTGNPGRDMGLYVMNPEEYGKAIIGNAAKGTAPTDIELLQSHLQAAVARGDMGAAQAIAAQLQKSNYIPPTTGRPGGWTIYPDGHKEFNPQAPAPGAMPVIANGQPTGVWTEDPSAAGIQAHQAGAIAGAQEAGKSPYQFQDVYNPATGQMEHVPVSEMVGSGGGTLNAHYGRGGAQAGPSGVPAGGHYAAAPPIGAVAAANTYGTGSAQGALDTQMGAEGSPIRVQAYREMESLLKGGLQTGPTQARMQELAEAHGLSFLAKDNAFVFNKDAALAVAQQAKALGLNSSDARFEAVAKATPNMKMSPQALAQVIPVRIGMEYASQAEATANANWIAQHGPQTNPQFKNYWRQNYDPRMFTAYAQGGPQALAKAPPQLRQQWLNDYRNLKALGVNFGQFAQ